MFFSPAQRAGWARWKTVCGLKGRDAERNPQSRPFRPESTRTRVNPARWAGLTNLGTVGATIQVRQRRNMTIAQSSTRGHSHPPSANGGIFFSPAQRAGWARWKTVCGLKGRDARRIGKGSMNSQRSTRSHAIIYDTIHSYITFFLVSDRVMSKFSGNGPFVGISPFCGSMRFAGGQDRRES